MNINDYKIDNIISTNSFDFYESEDIHTIANESCLEESKKNIEEIKNNDNEPQVNNIFTKETNNKIINYEDLLKEKSYYKLLSSDYKKFLKKINFKSDCTDTKTDITIRVQKTIDKTIVSNVVEMYSNLYKNIKKFKKKLFFVNENFNNQILILDGENILKTNKYQKLIKLHLGNTIFEKYFYNWFNGNNNGLIQPLSSLNISIKDKIFLLDIVITNYLHDYNLIIIISGKKNTDICDDNLFINNNKTLIIPILYDKDDIREQDDHLLLYLYYHYSKIKKCEIISGDKFKWFNHSENFIKNFNFEYDFHNNKINIKLCNAYSNDIIIYKNYKYQVGYFYFPFIKNLNVLVNSDYRDIIKNQDNYLNNFLIYLNNEQYEEMINDTIKIFLFSIELNYEKNVDYLSNYTNFITSLISKIIHQIKPNFEEIIKIINRISDISKKTYEKIEKNNGILIYKIIFDSNDSFSNLSSLTIESFLNDQKNSIIQETPEYIDFKKNMEKYFFLTEFYLIIKSMSFLLTNNKITIKIAKLFSYLIKIYDKIESNIYKIRKISNDSTFYNQTFLKILSYHIFIKKNGFCKKDY